MLREEAEAPAEDGGRERGKKEENKGKEKEAGGEKQPCSVSARPPGVLNAGGRGGRGEALWIP